MFRTRPGTRKHFMGICATTGVAEFPVGCWYFSSSCKLREHSRRNHRGHRVSYLPFSNPQIQNLWTTQVALNCYTFPCFLKAASISLLAIRSQSGASTHANIQSPDIFISHLANVLTNSYLFTHPADFEQNYN